MKKLSGFFLLFLTACGPKAPDEKSLPCLGTPCEKLSDCDRGLRCLHSVCVQTCDEVNDCWADAERCANVDGERFCADDDGLPFVDECAK